MWKETIEREFPGAQPGPEYTADGNYIDPRGLNFIDGEDFRY